VESPLITLTRWSSLIYILIFTAVAVIDLTIVNFSTFSGMELSPSMNVILFILFSMIFAISCILLLHSVRVVVSKSNGLPSRLKHLHIMIIAVQGSILAIMIWIILQMSLLNKYHLAFLQASTYITHISALLFLVCLVSVFLSWLKSRRNFIMMLYTIAFSLISLNIVISMIYLEYQYSFTNSNFRKPYPITSYVIRQQITPLSESLATAYDVLSLSSFSVIWLATLSLLKEYRFKLGRVKFFVLLSIPLVYYLFPFQSYFGNIFSSIAVASPVAFGIIYVLTFSATKQVGALLFSLAFWTASSLVVKDRIRKSLLISAIGMVILFGSIDITVLQYRLYPPYGLVTQAFMPLGSYMLFIGIFTSATGVSRDAQLRKEFYKSAKSQLDLLKTIGITQMEKELLKEYKPMLNRSRILEKYDDPHLEQSDVREMIRDVLSELQSREVDAKSRSKLNHK
jgi:hypothetical protein